LIEYKSLKMSKQIAIAKMEGKRKEGRIHRR
jgi:hypothetical protein